MARNGTWLLAVLLAGSPAAADDALLQQWDAPRRETFALKKMPGGEAALEVRRRYGYDFEFPATDGEVALKAKDATYFEALDRLAAGLGLCLVGVPAPEAKREFLEGGLALVKPDEPLGPAVAAYLGSSRLSVENVSVLAVRSLAPRAKPPIQGLPAGIGDVPVRVLRDIERFTPGAAERPRLRLQMKWIVEPGLDDVTLTAMTITQALDDKGQPLRARDELDVPIVANSTFAVDFEPPPPKVKAVRRVQGSARFAIPVERGEIAFLAAETGAPKMLGHASVTIDGIDGTTVRLTLVGTPSGILRDGTVPIEVGTGPGWRHERPDLTLIASDDKGAEIDGHRRESTSEAGRCTYKLELERAPAKLVFRAITKVAVRELPFVLNGIPLPE